MPVSQKFNNFIIIFRRTEEVSGNVVTTDSKIDKSKLVIRWIILSTSGTFASFTCNSNFLYQIRKSHWRENGSIRTLVDVVVDITGVEAEAFVFVSFSEFVIDAELFVIVIPAVKINR